MIGMKAQFGKLPQLHGTLGNTITTLLKHPRDCCDRIGLLDLLGDPGTEEIPTTAAPPLPFPPNAWHK